MPPTIGPTWEMIAMGALGLVVSLVAVYQRGMSGRIDKMERDVAAMNVALLREYHPKTDVHLMITDLKGSFHEYHVEMKSNFKDLKERFDKFEHLYGR